MSAMGDVTLLRNGKHRVAEKVFGWSWNAVEVGIHEFQIGISCVNDIFARIKPKTEEKNPEDSVGNKFPDSVPIRSEKDRRRYAAIEAAKLNHGGIAYHLKLVRH